ncbi:TonB-dependent receptor [Altererythrobacter sp. CC-YST694]|uniref:TonB-dependent receptor n=1 Tax=Altererythrobacter sp. CC-YST694 TaxID=2755038 RepID=UPI001D035D52|nr:TonB-dependent receptor [Altererythrobacter sp. CC-YST694]MCB5426428.1 TonB-dependent receptor [Altererythrobacter sp. CC-YST694]
MTFGKTRMRGTVSALAMVGAFALAAPALAQSADTESDAGSSKQDEIVVTAQFRDQRLQDVPVAITAVTGEMLEQRGQTNLADLGSTAPNVTLRQASATYGPAVAAYIRGVGQRDTTFALEPGVGIYVDDVYLPTLHGSMLGLVDLERVEILRGPQGTLAGQNSIGGAIKLYSKKPSAETDGYLTATYGSYNRMELRGAANFTLDEDHLYARISGAAVKKDGYITRYDYRCTHPTSTIPSTVTGTDCKIGTDGGKEYVAGRLALRWEPSSDITVDLVGDITRDGSETGPTTLLYVGRQANPGATLTGVATPASAAYVLNGNVYGTSTGSPYVSYSPFGNYAQDTFSHSPYISYENYLETNPRDGSGAWQAPQDGLINTWGVSGTITANLSDNVVLTSITAYRKFDGSYSSGDGSPFNATMIANKVYNHQFSQELRVTANINDVANLTVGGFYFDKESRNVSRVTLPTLNFIEDNSVPATTKAVFANVEITPVEALTILGGIRYTDQTKTFIYGRFGVPGSSSGGVVPPSLAPLNGLEGDYSGDRFDYRVGLQYRITDDVMTYAQLSTGFKGGGINPRPFYPGQALEHGPETLTAYEVGLKSDFLDRAVRLNLAAFYNKYDDILVSVSSCPQTGNATPCALPLNAGKADVKGFEAELALRPVAGLSIDASLAYLDFKYTSISASAVSSGIGTEDEGMFIIPWSWSIGAQYEIDLGTAGTLTPRVDVSHDDSYSRNANNVDAGTGGVDIFGRIPGRTLANARLTYRTMDEDWEVAFEVRNLTNKLYYTDFFDNRGSTNSIQGSPGEPRTWAVSVKRKF